MCTTVVVGRSRSATGSVLVAHSEELGRNSAHKVEVCPRRAPATGESYPLFSGGSLAQPPTLGRYLATKIFDKRHDPGEHTGGLNEHGVAVANNMALMRGIPEASACALVPGGVIWTELMQLVLERARAAREGAALVGELCGERGLSYDSGTMVAVADPGDAWWVELARDGQWVAARVSPDEVSMRANSYRIREVDFADPGRFLFSPTLVDHARERGWYRDGPFDFAAVYGDPANQSDAYNLDRHRAFESGYAGLETLAVPDLMRFLREVYAGTSLTGVYLPFHLGIEAVPPPFALATAEYDPRSAYWLFAELAKLADYGYPRCIDHVTATWRDFEAETFSALPAVEARAAGLGDEAACAVLTEFDRTRAAAAIDTLRRLLPEVKTRVFREDLRA